MPLPDRPIAGADIETEWGQEVHDWTFAPKGTWLHSTVSTSCSATPTQLRLDEAVSDPGGWLDASPLPGAAVAPAGSEGLYLIVVRIQTVNGAASGESTRGFISVNGAVVIIGQGDNTGGTNAFFTMTDTLLVTAGDIITVSAQRIGSTSPDVAVGSFVMVRLAEDIGA